ncbi:MAG: hypothetical protein Q4B31_01995, partial [Clostridia bacterium]|nr:hypothetical protein [Clostridia bacterium]
GANGRVYLVGKHNIEYEVGTVNYGAWNRLSATYANSSGGTVITPYLNGVNTGAVHSQYALGDFEAFDVRIAARTTAAEYAAKPTYEARGEYIKIDNVKMSPYSSALSEGTMITGIEQVDSKTLEVSFSATPPTLDGTAILLNGSTATTVASSSVTDNVATLTLAADLAPFTTYSYQPSGVLEAVYFTTGATYRANFDGTAADSATNGDTLVYSLSRASTISNNQLNMWAGYGGTAAYYNESADHDHGETVSITTPATINDATVVWAFDYNKNFDTVTRIVPRFSGQARYTFAPCFDIHANGDIYAVSTSEGDRKIAQIEPNTTNRLAMKITVSSSRNIMTTFYVNGVNCGTFTNNSAEFKAGLTGFTFYNTAYTSAEGNVLSPGRSDGRMENCLVDNMILTSDLSEVDYPLMASTVKAVDINTMRFETNLACTAPIAGDCLITDPAGAELTVTGVKKVSDTSFDVTVSEKLTANAVYDYDIFCGDEEIMGSFTAKLADRINYFNTSNGMPEYYSSAGTSKQQSVRVGKFGGSDKAFVWSPNENANGGIGAAAIHRDAAQLVWDVPAANLNKDKFVASTDFMIGSERVAAWVLSLTGSHYRHALANVSVDTAGTVDFAGTTIATIKPMEWHNVTLNVLVVSGGLVVDVYFDGVLKAENILVGNSNNAGITAIKTIAATDTPTDTAVAALANTDPGRYDVIALDNMYIGNDLTYKTSDIVLTASGNDVAASTGIIDRSDVGVTALYDSTGVIKNLKMTAFNAAKFSDVTVSGALSIDGAASGDIVKFFVVNDMLNITPLSNVVSATK